MFKLSSNVSAALKAGKAVVALESTIITHGMPYPQNLKCALKVEEILEKRNVVAATIAIIDGIAKIGLSRSELDFLAQTGLDAVKTSRRDIAHIVSHKLTGATTVSATMFLAHKAGIKIFVTGGIGGVHHGNDMDVSADLTELARTPVAVVCAGAKSILDIPRTLEFLETSGVTVVTCDKSKEFPAFYTRSSGFKTQAAIPDPDKCAALIDVNEEMGLNSGIVIAVPIPLDSVPQSAPLFPSIIKTALESAVENKIKGKNITPYLLDAVKKATDGEALEANIALVMNNARIGAEIALGYAQLRRERERERKSLKQKRQYSTFSTRRNARHSNQSRDTQNPKRIAVIGGAVMDILATTHVIDSVMKSTSTPGTIACSSGGVARNIAQVIAQCKVPVSILCNISTDAFGNTLIKELVEIGVDCTNVEKIENQTTAVYNSMFDSRGELIAAVADMKIHNNRFPSSKILKLLESCNLVVMDTNINKLDFQYVVEKTRELGVKLLIDPTSVPKSSILLTILDGHKRVIEYLTPDLHEARHLVSLMGPFETQRGPDLIVEGLEEGLETAWGRDIIAMRPLLKLARTVIIKCGDRGAVLMTRRPVQNQGDQFIDRISVVPPLSNVTKVVTVNGAGDSLVAVFCVQLLMAHAAHAGDGGHDYAGQHAKLVEYLQDGVKAAELSLTSLGVSTRISRAIFGATEM